MRIEFRKVDRCPVCDAREGVYEVRAGDGDLLYPASCAQHGGTALVGQMIMVARQMGAHKVTVELPDK